MYKLIQTLSYGGLLIGFLIIFGNLFDMFAALGRGSLTAKFRVELIGSVVVGALFVSVALFSLSREMDEWRSYTSALYRFIKTYKVWLISVTAISVIGSFVLLGLPGAILLSAFDFVLDSLLIRPLGWMKPHGDTSWPMAIGYTLLIPWICFGIFLGVKRFFMSMTDFWTSITVGIITFSLVFLVHFLYRFLSRHG